ncbi:hypothetical protein H7S74_30305 [Priestia aryabhattai]|uniref:hypothetical protein n=1 Tax=Priestia aryabhattai TaxID=412384 RepID=UPI001EB848AF|nr:hypothetical protein [Priestia aryabhattai]MBY0094924.1 hypothetical protein [Priestia aryabhattai]MBY0105588.1 hypothetical protein [Priestia aryabhattai]
MKIIENGKEIVLTPIPELMNHGIDVYKAYLCDTEGGRIWSVRSGRFLVANPNYKGYCYVTCSAKGKGRPYSVHVLVYSSYSGMKQSDWRAMGLEVNHITNRQGNSKNTLNGIKDNNKISNLELVTHKQQFEDKHDPNIRAKLGTTNRLTIPEVREILQAWIDFEGEKRSTFVWEMVEKYGVGYQSIIDVLEGNTYKNLSESDESEAV